MRLKYTPIYVEHLGSTSVNCDTHLFPSPVFVYDQIKVVIDHICKKTKVDIDHHECSDMRMATYSPALKTSGGIRMESTWR